LKKTIKVRDKKPNIYILIAAYLEGPSIFSVISGIKKKGYGNIIVVDDGSTDNTYSELLRTKGVIVTKHIINRGKGASIRTGMEIAKDLNADIVVTMDGDGQHNPENIDALITKVQDGLDVALGTRAEDLENMPLIKRVANFFGNVFSMIIFGISVSDSQCGFRAYSRKAIDKIRTTADRYGYDPEVLKEIKRHKLTYAEVPVDAIYTKHSQTKAERQTFMNGLRTLGKMISSA
jgi:UDP-N-acetylglucosamine---dolichyl-phosphate N-acetylglucosaminyltransferase